MTPLEYLLCFILVSISGFMSAAEVSLFSLSRFQLRYLRDHFRPSYRRIKKLLADPPGLLITTLILNEVLNVAISTIITNAIARDWAAKGSVWKSFLPDRLHAAAPEWALQSLAGFIVTIPILLLFCESTPKVTAARLNQLIAPLTSGPLLMIYRLFRPVRVGLMVTVRLLTGRLRAKSGVSTQERTLLKEDEFLSLVEEGHREGTIHELELDLVRNVFDLDDTEAVEVCTPMTKTFTLPMHMKLAEASKVAVGNPHSRIPVIDKSKKDVVGILYFKDLIQVHLNPEIAALPISSVMHEPYFVPAKMKLNTLFRRLKNLKSHLAVVRNEADEAVGVVTMGDILTEIFEDLFQEPEPAPVAPAKPAGALK